MINLLNKLRQQQAGGTTPPPVSNDKYPTGNPASSGVNEGVSLVDITGAGTATVSNDSFDGSSISILFTNLNGGGYISNIVAYPITAGKTYSLSIHAKVGASGTTQKIEFIISNRIEVDAVSWTLYEQSYVAATSGTANLVFYTSFGGALNDELYVDNISIIES